MSKQLLTFPEMRSVLRKPRGAASPYRWCAVALVFGLGITYSKTLCERFGYDPQEILRP